MTVLHQATASDTGLVYIWTAASYDHGAGYPGTGSPENILALSGMPNRQTTTLAVDPSKIWRQKSDGSAPEGVKMPYSADLYAAGDNTADDTAGLNACFAAAHTAGQTSVYIPPGTYKLTDRLVVPDGLTIRGDGWHTILRQSVREKNCIEPGNQVTLEGLHLVGDRGTTAVSFNLNIGILAKNCRGLVVRGCHIEGFECGGIQLRQCRDAIITDNVLFANQEGTQASAADILTWSDGAFIGCMRLTITGNHCLSNNSQGIQLDSEGWDIDMDVGGNICITLDPTTCTETGDWTLLASGSLVRRHGIFLGYGPSYVGGPRCRIHDNICGNTQWTGIACEGHAPYVGVEIVDNLCFLNGYNANSIAAGIHVVCNGGERIDGNKVLDFQGGQSPPPMGGIVLISAIYAIPSTPISCRGNTISGSAGWGIYLDRYTALVQCTDNILYGNAFTDIAVVGIGTVASAGKHLISRNSITRTVGGVFAIYAAMPDTAHPTIVEDNSIIGADNTTQLDYNTGIYFYDADGKVIVRRNYVRNFYYGIGCQNYFSGGRLPAIQFEGNIIEDCAAGFLVSSNTSTDQVVPLVGNRFINTPVQHTGASPTLGLGQPSAGYVCQREGDRLVIETASAAPTVGTWIAGDRTYFTSPAPAGFIGAVCTTGGNPGTWKTWGLISA